MPRPLFARLSLALAWTNMSNTQGSASAAMPIPVSRTRHQRCAVVAPRDDADAPARVGVAHGIVEQVREHLRQAHRVGLDQQRLPAAGRRSARGAAASISGRLVSTAAAITSARSTTPLRSSILPRVMRDTSIRSSTRRTMWLTWRSIISHIWPAGPAAPESRSRLTELRIGASGLRSSWASVARNSSLRRSASSRSQQVRPRLVLALARAQRAVHRARQRGDPHRALEQGDVAERAHRALHRRRIGAGAREHQYRQIGPLRLALDQIDKAAVVWQRFLGDQDSGCAALQLPRQAFEVGARDARHGVLAQHCLDQRASLPIGASTSSRRSRRSPGRSLTT